MSSTPTSEGQPLGLTVHTLPDVAGVTVGRTRAGRWKMLAVLLVCAAPVVASYFTFYVVRPDGRRNFGELIEPQRQLPDVIGTALDGKPVNLRTLKDQWLLVSVAPAACNDLAIAIFASTLSSVLNPFWSSRSFALPTASGHCCNWYWLRNRPRMASILFSWEEAKSFSLPK